MRTRNRCFALITLSGLAAAVAGCGTPKEMTAPCKRPANLTSYAAAQRDCGPMTALNTDQAAALAAVHELAAESQE